LPVVSVVVVLPEEDVVGELVEEELLPPQPAIAKLEARTAKSVSMAVSGVLFMVGRLRFVLDCSPAQPTKAPCEPTRGTLR
jgi:hypothetical protein